MPPPIAILFAVTLPDTEAFPFDVNAQVADALCPHPCTLPSRKVMNKRKTSANRDRFGCGVGRCFIKLNFVVSVIHSFSLKIFISLVLIILFILSKHLQPLLFNCLKFSVFLIVLITITNLATQRWHESAITKSEKDRKRSSFVEWGREMPLIGHEWPECCGATNASINVKKREERVRKGKIQYKLLRSKLK